MSKSYRNIAILTSYYVPAYKGGGPIRTLEALVRNTPSRFLPLIFTSDRDLQESGRLPVDANRWVRHENARVFYASTDSLAAYMQGLLALRRKNPDVLYLNSYFAPQFSIFPLALAKVHWFGKTDVLVAPRGEFSSGALGLKPVRKAIYLKLTNLLGLYNDVTWHASSELEAADIRAAQPKASRIIVKENDTLLEPRELPEFRLVDRESHRLRAVFASRIVPKKGLDIILRSLGTIENDVVMDVIGAEEDEAYVTLCRKIAENLPDNIEVNFVGALPHAKLLTKIANYDVMLFPTLGENFGHVVAEALSVGLPVYCSEYTPWATVLMNGGGGVVAPNTPESWMNLISALASCSSTEIRARRQLALVAFRLWASKRNDTSLFELFEKGMSGRER